MQCYAKTIVNIFAGKSKKVYHFHFVGIGGVSMRSLAILLKEFGQEVSGSDIQKSSTTKALGKKNIKVYHGHSEKNIWKADFVIYNFAVEHCVEVKKAKELGLVCLSRAELLGLYLKQFKNVICIAGAHGKTTTTALIYSCLKHAGLCPSLHLGGNLTQTGEGHVHDGKNFIVCEACEYKDAFLHLKPSVAVILNTAPEHLDYFKTISNIQKSFNTFAKDAKMLICSSEHVSKKKNKITFGKNGDFFAKNVVNLKNGKQMFDCFKKGKYYGTFQLNLLGEHNIQNALACIAVCNHLCIAKEHVQSALMEFRGVERRFQFLNKEKFIVHDYAHHPDEILAVLKQARQVFTGKLLVVFQPHTYTRTKTLMNEFVNILSEINELAIYKTYSAREKYIKSGSAKTLCKKIGGGALYFGTKKDLKEFVLQKVLIGYGVLFLGAGNIFDIAKDIDREVNNTILNNCMCD